MKSTSCEMAKSMSRQSCSQHTGSPLLRAGSCGPGGSVVRTGACPRASIPRWTAGMVPNGMHTLKEHRKETQRPPCLASPRLVWGPMGAWHSPTLAEMTGSVACLPRIVLPPRRNVRLARLHQGGTQRAARSATAAHTVNSYSAGGASTRARHARADIMQHARAGNQVCCAVAIRRPNVCRAPRVVSICNQHPPQQFPQGPQHPPEDDAWVNHPGGDVRPGLAHHLQARHATVHNHHVACSSSSSAAPATQPCGPEQMVKEGTSSHPSRWRGTRPAVTTAALP